MSGPWEWVTGEAKQVSFPGAAPEKLSSKMAGSQNLCHIPRAIFFFPAEDHLTVEMSQGSRGQFSYRDNKAGDVEEGLELP